MKYFKDKDKDKYDLKNRIIQRQVNEIEQLKQKIVNLEISCEQKEKFINSINYFRDEFVNIVADLTEKNNKCDELIKELLEMRTVINNIVFKRKWKLIRLLLR